MVSLFGGQLMTSQYRCGKCLSYFEQIRWDGNDTGDDPGDRKDPGRD
jgi:hypothetical protein